MRLWSLFNVLLIEDVDARNLRDRCFRWNVPCGPRWCRSGSASAGLVLFGLQQLRRRGEVRNAPALPVVEDDASRGVDVLKTSEKSNKSDKKTTHIVEIPCEIP